MTTDVTLPQLGETVSEGTIVAWLVQPGDAVNEGDPLVEVSTDKVDTEIPSPATGTLMELLASNGDTVEVGALIARIGNAPGTETVAPSHHEPPKRPKASPAARRLAQELNIDRTSLVGTGADGAITKGDVESADRGSTQSERPPRQEPLKVAPAEREVADGAPSELAILPERQIFTAKVAIATSVIDRSRADHSRAAFVIRAVVDALRELQISISGAAHPLEPSMCHTDAVTGTHATLDDAAELRLAAITARLAKRSHKSAPLAGVVIVDCTDSACTVVASNGSSPLSITIGPAHTQPRVQQTESGSTIVLEPEFDLELTCHSDTIDIGTLNRFGTTLKATLETRDWTAEL